MASLEWSLLLHLLLSGPRFALGVVDPTDAEKRLLWKYPDCEHLRQQEGGRVNWPWYRDQLHRFPYPNSIAATVEVMDNMSGSGSAAYDEEALRCPMGVPAAFYTLARYNLDILDADDEAEEMRAERLRMINMQYSVFENYISVFHPGLFERANWTISDEDAGWLRREVLRHQRVTEQGMTERHLQERQSRREAIEADNPVRVYVYEEEEIPELRPLLQGQIYCSRGMWGMDVTIHDFFATCACRTDDPKEADFFFVPGYAICLLEGNIFKLEEVNDLYVTLVNALPYFNITGGRDHVFVFGSGMAHSVFQGWRDYISRSVVLTPETELFNDFAWIIEPPYDTWRDIAIPGALDLTEVVSLLRHSRPLPERTYLAAFFGRVDIARGPHPWVGGVDVRKGIINLMEDAEAVYPGEFAHGDNQTHDVMHGAYGNARFCFVPRGKSGWSLRLFEALFAGCVPVILSDKWELPFEDFLDVSTFVIKWPSTQIGMHLIDYLRRLPNEVVQRYMDAIVLNRCHYFYTPRRHDIRRHLQAQHGVCPDDSQSAFQGILKMLKRRRRLSRTSQSTFFLRDNNGTVRLVDANLQEWP